ncbi:MAG: YkgJ family cysteine cluster protein [archaeon]
MMTETSPVLQTACQKCGECCKRYAISVLPHELKKQATALQLSEEQFTSIYTQLLLQVTPAQSGEHKLSIHTSLLPKDFVEVLHKAGIDSEHVMLLPMLGFRRQEYCVFFDKEKMGCSIHAVKPMQCNIFPFVGINVEDYAKTYDFCELARISSPTDYTYAQVALQGSNMKKYFDSVAENGMESIWKHVPSTGTLMLKGKAAGTIHWSALKNWLQWAREKNES